MEIIEIKTPFSITTLQICPTLISPKYIDDRNLYMNVDKAIWSAIHKLRIPHRHQEDAYQEAWVAYMQGGSIINYLTEFKRNNIKTEEHEVPISTLLNGDETDEIEDLLSYSDCDENSLSEALKTTFCVECGWRTDNKSGLCSDPDCKSNRIAKTKKHKMAI